MTTEREPGDDELWTIYNEAKEFRGDQTVFAGVATHNPVSDLETDNANLIAANKALDEGSEEWRAKYWALKTEVDAERFEAGHDCGKAIRDALAETNRLREQLALLVPTSKETSDDQRQ